MARLVDVRVPDMGSFSEVAIIDVLVKPGDAIDKDGSLITLETEKATMDVPSDVAGVIEKIHVQKGGKVSPGDVVATVRAEGEAGSAAGAASAEKSASGLRPRPPRRLLPQRRGMARPPRRRSPPLLKRRRVRLLRRPPRRAVRRARRPPQKTGAPASAAASVSSNGARTSRSPPSPEAAPTSLRSTKQVSRAPTPVRRSASLRARARRRSCSSLTGTGFKTRITHDDVKAWVKKALTGGAPAGAKGTGVGLPSVPVVDFAKFGPVEVKPLSRIQKISGPRLHASWVNIPHVTQFDEADITDLEEARGKLKQKAQESGIKLTPLAFIVRACAKALSEFPLFNSSLDATGANLVLKKYVNIGFAADTPNGLIVPVIANADKLDVYEIARQLADLSEKGRAGKLSANEMQGGTFTISSLGGIGGTAFTPIINAPEVAILGVSKSSHKPVYQNGAFVPRLMLPLSLSYDHRVIDGAAAARFAARLAVLLADAPGLLEAVP